MSRKLFSQRPGSQTKELHAETICPGTLVLADISSLAEIRQETKHRRPMQSKLGADFVHTRRSLRQQLKNTERPVEYLHGVSTLDLGAWHMRQLVPDRQLLQCRT